MVNKKGVEERIIEYMDLDDRDRALGLIMKHYTSALMNVSYQYLGDIDLAKDVLQDSMYKIWTKMNTFDRNKSSLYTWMYRVVINKSIDGFRSRSKARAKFSRDGDDYSHVDFHGTYSFNIDTIDLPEKLGMIHMKYREILRMTYFEGLTQEEISEKLEIPLGTVKSRYRIGLREMRKLYSVKG